MKNFKELLPNVKAFVFDVDGVLTDGTISLMPDGEQIRTMNMKDGYAMQLAVKLGYKIAIISGGKSEAVRKRLNGLGIYDVYLAVENKLDALDEFMFTYGYTLDDILYMGDDMPDWDLMKRIGIPTCPNDAVSDIRAISIYISPMAGGKGCVRDVIEQVLRVNSQWK